MLADRFDSLRSHLGRIPTTIAVVGLVLGYIGYGMVQSRVHEMRQQLRKAFAA